MFSLATRKYITIQDRPTSRFSVPPISQKIVLRPDFFGKKLPVKGEYPSRVAIGDVLFGDNKIRLISPVNGIARLEEETGSIRLTIDGILNKKPEINSEEFDLEEFKTIILNSGLVSLDFEGVSLLDMFETAKKNREFLLVFNSYNYP